MGRQDHGRSHPHAAQSIPERAMVVAPAEIHCEADRIGGKVDSGGLVVIESAPLRPFAPTKARTENLPALTTLGAVSDKLPLAAVPNLRVDWFSLGAP